MIMKRINNKILLLTLSTMLVIIFIFSYVSFRFANNKVNELYDDIIGNKTTLWSNHFENFLKQKEDSIDIVKYIIEKRFSLEILEDPDLLEEEFNYISEIMSSIVITMNYLNLYSWFHPDFTSPDLRMLSVRNYALDGEITIETGFKYSTEDMTAENWAWFNDTLVNDKNISDPFDWEGYSNKLSSFTKSIIINNKKVGVIGSDYYIDELEQMMLEEPFMGRGYYALLNSDLAFLVNPRHFMEEWERVFPDDAEKTTEILMDKSISSGVLISGNQKIGFDRMSNGWIVLAVPDMNLLNRVLIRLPVTYLILTVIVSVVVGILSLTIAKNISKPIIDASNYSIKIAAGELDTSLSAGILNRKDEIGTLGNNLESMRKSLKNKIKKLKHESQKSKFLYRELEHRTKNNLQLILSFISFELNDEKITDIRQVLENVKRRIYILSTVQDLINVYEDQTYIQFKDFLNEILNLLSFEYNLYESTGNIILTGDSSLLNKQNLVPVGFLINEIFSSFMDLERNSSDSFSISIDVNHINDSNITSLNISTDIINKNYTETINGNHILEIIKEIAESQLQGSCDLNVADKIKYSFKFSQI